MSTTKGFPLVAELKDAVDILKMDKVKMATIANKKSATKWGIVILAVPFVVNLVLSLLVYPSGFRAIFSKFLFWPVAIPMLSLVGSIFAISLVAEKFFKGKGSHMGFFRVAAYASLASWLSILPFLLGLLGSIGGAGLASLLSLAVSIWILFVMFNALMVLHKLNQQDATLSLVGGIIAYLIVQALLGAMLVGGSYRYY